VLKSIFYLEISVDFNAFLFQEAWSSMIISDLDTAPDPSGQLISDRDPDPTCQVITDPDTDPDM